MVNLLLFMKRLSRIPRRVVRESIMLGDLLWFSLINRFGRSPVTQPGGPTVSMTTFGKRSQKVHLAIESIARGTSRPSRLILWIDDVALFEALPPAIRRLQKRGLEVRLCWNYGPHAKYYPYVESQEVFDNPLVTADDDLLYPRYWLEKLVRANKQYPETVNCFWAHVVGLGDDGFRKYAQWKQCNSTCPSHSNLALGVMGVLYPPSFLLVLKRAGAAFEACCPKADDLWLHVQALRSGHKVRQVLSRLPYYSFHPIPQAHKIELSYENVTYGDGNDRQIAITYSRADLEMLRAECTAAGGD